MRPVVKQGFTLIELLVVIAIIAILAAILFPVFAQAKLAAKGAASLSNTKQQGLAEIMYTNDYDDAFTPGATWIPWDGNVNTFPPGSFACFGTSIGCAQPWDYLIVPYIKTAQLFDDPLSPGHFTVPSNQSSQDIYTPTYSFDFAALAPYSGNSDGSATTKVVTSTQPKSPSNVVMMVTSHSMTDILNQQSNGAIIFSPNGTNVSKKIFDFGPLYNSAVDPPNCFVAASFCLANWGQPDNVDPNWLGFFSGINGGGANPSAADQTKLAISEGENTGGVARRVNDGIETVFADGHAKNMRPGALAAGTNWSDGLQEGNLVWNGPGGPGVIPSNYMWGSPEDGG